MSSEVNKKSEKDNDGRKGTKEEISSIPTEDNLPEGLTSDEFDKLPEQIRHQFQRIQMGMVQASSGPRHHPLFEKFTEDHIHKYLDYAQKDDDNEFNLKSSNRWFAVLYAILGIGVFLFLVVYLLPNNQDLLGEILKLLVAFAGGLGSGFGLKSVLDRKKV